MVMDSEGTESYLREGWGALGVAISLGSIQL